VRELEIFASVFRVWTKNQIDGTIANMLSMTDVILDAMLQRSAAVNSTFISHSHGPVVD